ncbi:MetQ/NlpA family ABC transporter substrate-binding protein [Leucobacter sp. G161]|uniref:MetQ/NlpA family ABC transporter substrate-binding protein n=1 Tax=Leucobacter sp. G161 TaxID=663704 RepID=UPI00073CA4BB|nr:MetQ/NlpA family ABC transporter substrate-binding protein [Leucobacter sp. G161]KUF07991.1 D-methionine-binding lipoprotein MetQ [Leucobacter sp. G161]
MKRSPLALLAGTAAILLLVGCSSTPAEPAGDTPDSGATQVLKVAATTTPMPDVVRAAAEAIEAPYEIELVEVADYVQPNTMLAAGELDANFVQHPPFMEDFNAGNNASLVAIEPVYLTVVGTYSSKHDSMADIPEKGHIVVPQDLSNQSRALQMYAEAGLITLDPTVDKWEVTVKDITANPKNLEFTEVDLMQLNAAYPEADGVFLHGTFARQLGLVPGDDAIAVEQDPQFAVSLVSRNDNQDSPEVKALAKAFHSDEVRAVLEEFEVPAAF